MKFTITGKKLEVSEELRAYAEKKVGKLEKFFKEEPEASAGMPVEDLGDFSQMDSDEGAADAGENTFIEE